MTSFYIWYLFIFNRYAKDKWSHGDTQHFQATESFQKTTVTLNHFILYNGLEYCQLVMQTMVFIIKKKKSQIRKWLLWIGTYYTLSKM